MSNLFDDFEFDDDEPAPAPDWLRDLDDDKPATGAAAPTASAPAASSPGIDLDRLREKSARAGAMDDEIAADATVVTTSSTESGNFFNRMSPAQRLIIAVFFVVDVCVVGVGLLLLVGAI